MLADLVSFWRKCRLQSPPFVHPDDLSLLRARNGRFADFDPVDFDGFDRGQRFGDFTDHRFHLSLLPAPYGGDLRNAEIVILLLNPGFSYADYWAESKSADFRRRREGTLRQSFHGVSFPFMNLDPQFCWHSGFVWWEQKLRDVATVLAAKKFKNNYFLALRDLSRRLACVELVPYHSPSFKAHALINELSSVKMIRAFVLETLIPDANAGKRTLIVTRQERAWNLPSRTKNLVVYRGGHTKEGPVSALRLQGEKRFFGVTESRILYSWRCAFQACRIREQARDILDLVPAR